MAVIAHSAVAVEVAAVATDDNYSVFEEGERSLQLLHACLVDVGKLGLDRLTGTAYDPVAEAEAARNQNGGDENCLEVPP